ncbi:MAG: ribonuclease HI [Candidatus Magasanikbacteria bacterium]|nr:ribonuclease HI [Candidatus Magasanikbacteria bacterium]
MCYDSRALKIYTDGSARPTNPGPGGIGVVVEYPDEMSKENERISEGYYQSTNNRMELLACIRGYEFVINNSRQIRATWAILITDSQYVYSNHSRVLQWKKNGWKNAYGKPIENEDLWGNLLKAQQKAPIKIEIKWEEGKTRGILQDVDALAKAGALSPIKKDFGYVPGRITSRKTRDKKAATLFPAANQEVIIRTYRIRIKGKGKNAVYVVSFELYSEETKDFVKKHVAYTSADNVEMHRGNHYRVQFNNSPAYPLFEIVGHVEKSELALY